MTMHHIHEMHIEDYDEVSALWEKSEGVGLNESDTREHVVDYLAHRTDLCVLQRPTGEC